MICSHCKAEITTGKPMVSIGLCGNARHFHFHTGDCLSEHMRQQLDKRDTQKSIRLHADIETVQPAEQSWRY